ncbi:acetylornithine deacetylase [Arsenophonus nasoniae]|uniref:Acetylornithine deacetylase n=1 Tax=Arsenophonus nasoniae TaxID=638 RepID=D2U433_9GAMM|nr:acetylornithine deacetylase [Arsenophonus nasoniae]QBY45004.1 Acetylornithine deacetylase [Arsenophonus nasoniae]WGM05230.1 acetylornithine deacetylase [Arsenophonus nasoniae]WGM10240.1 acetylornithine deacetylase [Arsenophonus nasoniae]WGM14956.1 acetylornithine deacetylase [Arsenophonus nasoniae]CBA76259.1 acetylornithine deacetylase [Arsenophonus nasoniae]
MKAKLPTFIELYRQLIAIPSISSVDARRDQSNEALINLLAEWLKTLGGKITIQPVPETRHKFNLLATFGQGEEGLLLCGHTDTVPFDEGRWTKDPFQLTEYSNKLYGLGSADMKGFFAFIIDALRNIDIYQLQHPIYILATADEETTMAGARYFATTAEIQPELAIIGEPTSLRPIRAHKGHIANAIRITGQSGHSSDPAKGINAIELMHETISQLIMLRNRLKTDYHHKAFAIPYPTMNFGHIHGGDAVNRICGCCELHIDIRPLPGLSLQNLDELLHAALEPIKHRWPNRITIEELHPAIPGFECPINHKMLKIIENLLNKKAQTVNYCTEAPFIQTRCPTLILGPGSIEQAHQPDEFIEIKYIKPTIALLSQMITHFCLKK